MADPTVPWGIPLFDDNTPFAPIQAPFNSRSAALNDALTAGAFQPYATKALLDAAPGTRAGQHASVYADGTAAYNGDYIWGGSVWVQTWTSGGFAPFTFAAGVGSVTFGSANVSFNVAMPAGRFTAPPIVTMLTRSSNYGTKFSAIATTVTNISVLGTDGQAGLSVPYQWTAVQMTPTSAAG